MENQKLSKNELKKLINKMISSHSLSNGGISNIILVIFPSTNVGKNDYYNKVLGYLTPIATQKRLHIDPVKFGTFSDLIGGPCDPTATPPNTNGTAGTWNYVYPLEKDKATFTYPLSDAKKALVISIKEAILDMYSDIPDSAINKTDTLTLGITAKADRKKPVLTPAKITSSTVIGLTPIGGGNVEIMIRTSKDVKRASKLNRSVDIEIAWSIVAPTAAGPTDSTECNFVKIITTARYLLQLGEKAPGNKLYLFARWVYTSHEEQSGSFGSAATCNIS